MEFDQPDDAVTEPAETVHPADAAGVSEVGGDDKSPTQVPTSIRIDASAAPLSAAGAARDDSHAVGRLAGNHRVSADTDGTLGSACEWKPHTTELMQLMLRPNKE
jgi:hypothetical protein